MSSLPHVLTAAPRALHRGRHPAWPRPLRGSELAWALAFVVPYAAVFAAFVVYPVAYGLWMAREPALYRDLISNPLYVPTLVNTLVYVGFGVNVKLFLALLLSGFFMRRRWWIRALLPVYMLPWALPAIPAFVSFHWMLIGEEGLVDRLLAVVFGLPGPLWFTHRSLALGADIVAYIWKWMPFWTLTFFAARTAIPQDIYEAAAVDGASGHRRFLHVVLPLLGNLYLVCTLLSTVWTIGDFTTVYLVSEGAPMYATNVLATLGIHYAFEAARPELGMAAVMTALPLLIPIVIVLMRVLHTRELQL
ncbi:MAG TPA: sugar ABC transporter permease [Methylomirabilota bacterium]|jgi:multiple sugar transport system permease protein|nr:sugar ABC transporter permease [Methylomirabilota bacterium]